MKKGFKFEIAPTLEQKHYLNRVLGSTRFVWNTTLGRTIKEYNAFKKDPSKPKPNVSSTGLTYRAKPLREEFSFLQEIPSIVIQQAQKDLGKAYDHFFKKTQKTTGFPNFKSKSKNRDSFRLTDNGFKLENNSLYIAKLKTPIKVFWSRALPSFPSSVTISKTPTGRYYASFVCEYESNRKSGKGTIGIDVGLKTYAITSNPKDEPIENPKFLKQSLKKLAKAQRKHSKKQKQSKNRNKSRLKVSKIHEKIANQRRDFQHKVTTKLVSENQALVMETLNVKGMIKNRKLSRAIADASWGQFRGFVKYKISESSNGQLILADPFFPSTQLCSKCNQKAEKKLTLKDEIHDCKCGKRMDRDLNAAKSLETMGRVFLNNRPEYKGFKIVMAPKYQDFLFYPEYQPKPI